MTSKLFGIIFAIILGIFASMEMANTEPEQIPDDSETVTTQMLEYPVTVETQELVTPSGTAIVVREHTVQPGDTLSQIAETYLGSQNLYPLIAQKNNVTNPDLIFPGQLFQIETEVATEPVYQTVTHTELRREVISFEMTPPEDPPHNHEEETENRSSPDEKLTLIETSQNQNVLHTVATLPTRPAAACMLKLQNCDRSLLVNFNRTVLLPPEVTVTKSQVETAYIEPPVAVLAIIETAIVEPPPVEEFPLVTELALVTELVPEPIAPVDEAWQWPIFAPLSDTFGICNPRLRRSCHTGIDIDLYWYAKRDIHAEIAASKSGTVTSAHCSHKDGYGCRVEIEHENGFSSLYAHLSEVHLIVGQSVSQGDRVGLSGLTGHTTGEHLHYEIRLDGVPQNPMHYLP